MEKQELIESLINFKQQVIVYEKASSEYQESVYLLEKAKIYQPKRLSRFDDEYLPKFINDKNLGKKPKEFIIIDPRRISKKRDNQRKLKIENYNKEISKATEEYYLANENQREKFKVLDKEEKENKIKEAEKKVEIKHNIFETESQKIEACELLPSSLISTEIIEKLIGYFKNWRADTIKEAINIYFEEKWKIEESKKNRVLFQKIENQLTETNELIKQVDNQTQQISNELSEVSNIVSELQHNI
ncbi:hypothetical protein [Pseudolactococcus raffinolactis]|uniref:hypothetical protein n=1 Tax=Pseudolactococcus raffinolactis TaxID=1366 RepID=UPI001436C3DF|nr:hypothetical protein [Lactococcus raffinolactis]QIW52116.1 hypothetical protein GU337_09605 [Lactococcus raffinolactis]